MIITKRRDPGATFMTVAMALVWTFLLIRGVQWIFAGSRFEHFYPVRIGDTITATRNSNGTYTLHQALNYTNVSQLYITDPGGWGGVTLAHNVRSREAVDAVLAEAAAAGAARPSASTTAIPRSSVAGAL